jgi:hypothetical protein
MTYYLKIKSRPIQPLHYMDHDHEFRILKTQFGDVGFCTSRGCEATSPAELYLSRNVRVLADIGACRVCGHEMSLGDGTSVVMRMQSPALGFEWCCPKCTTIRAGIKYT